MKSRIAWAMGVCLLAGVGAAGWQLCAQAATGGTQMEAEGPAGTPQSWAEDVIRNEIKVIEAADKMPLRYRERKVGAKGDTTREMLVSREGNVARLIERDGQPITEEEDADERARLMDEIAAPDDFLKRRHRDAEMRDSVIKVVALMPQAMVFRFAPGQPQIKGREGQVVMDFRPDPKFHPPTMLAECLTGLEGRVWIDPRTRTLTHIEARVLRPVNMGFGIVAKIYPGGTLVLDQTNLGGERWVYSHLDEHLTTRLLMVKNYPENTVMTAWDFRTMTSLLPYQDGIRELLAMHVATK